MPRVILTSRYLKNASSGKLNNLMKYIGSREGVELNKTEVDQDSPSTEKQKHLIKQLEKDFDIKGLLEYDDYLKNSTVENASELIQSAIDNNIDVSFDKENFVRYMGMRPNVEKNGSHGLFTQNDLSHNLSEIAEEVASHKGNVWSHVLSLRREDAERLSYNNQKCFKYLFRNKMAVMAKAHNISLEEMKWFAAFHNEGHHPHVHFIVYSDNVKKGFLTNMGIESMRSAFANGIFKDELHHIYEEQTDIRNKLRNEAKAKAEQLIGEIESGVCDNKHIEELILKLHRQLETVNGKKIYGYLPKETKDTINEIVKELATDERISELYKLWYELDLEKLKNYKDKLPDNVPLEKHKEFTSIKNAVIQAALSLNTTLQEYEFNKAEAIEELPDPEHEDDNSAYISIKKVGNEKGGNITTFYEHNVNDQSDNKKIPFWKNPGFKDYQTGNEFITGNTERQDIEKGLNLLKSSSELGCDMAAYYLGKVYLKGEYVQQDVHEAVKWFEKAAESNNEFAEYKLGKIYASGIYLKKDLNAAERWFRLATEQDNHFAQYALGVLHLGEELYHPHEALNLITKAAQHENQFALLKLGRIYLEGKLVPKNTSHAVELLKRSAVKNNSYAEYALGKLYLYGKDVPKDTETALYYLKLSAEHDNIYAKQLLEQYEKNQFNFSSGAAFGLFQSLTGMFRNRMGLHRNHNGKAHDSNAEMWRKNEAIEYMAKYEDDEHIDKFLEHYASECDLTKNSLLSDRYHIRGDWSKNEPLRQLFLFQHIDQLTGNVSLWQNFDKPKRLDKAILRNNLQINLLHNLCEQVPDEKHPISGNGEVDLWVEPRLGMGFRKACYLASSGDLDNSFIVLEDTVSLLEKAMRITSPVELRCTSSWLDLIIWTAEEDWNNPGGSPILANEEERLLWIHNADSCFCLYPSMYKDILTAESGWEWFDPIRHDPRFNEYINRLNALVKTRLKKDK